MSGYLIVGSIVVALLLVAPILARQQANAQRKRNGWIQCDLCDELMRPDGLHISENFSLFFPSSPRIHRHTRHIIRTQLFKQTIYGDPKRRQLKEASRKRVRELIEYAGGDDPSPERILTEAQSIAAAEADNQ